MTQLISENERKHTSNNPLRRYAIDQFFLSIDRFFPPADIVLDAGCGEGYDVARILDANPQLIFHGIDISSKAVQKSRTMAPTMHSVVGSVFDLPYPDKSFDLVISLEVLEHLDNPPAAIAEYKRVTRRYLLLSVPNEPIFRSLRLLNGMNVAQLGDHPEHVQHWSINSFRKMLRDQGLTIVDSVVPVPYIWSIVLCEIA